MLARRLTTILPMMTVPEALETTRVHRVAGRTGARTALVTARPFRAPHHPIADVGLLGGGHLPRPGEGSLAHHGGLVRGARPACRRVLTMITHGRSEGHDTAQSPQSTNGAEPMPTALPPPARVTW